MNENGTDRIIRYGFYVLGFLAGVLVAIAIVSLGS